MRQREISEDMIRDAVRAAERVIHGDHADLYEKVIVGRRMRVVVAKDTDPGLVITVMWRD